MSDEQTTPSNTPNPDETTPIEPVVVADQGPMEASAPVAAPADERNPWIRRGLVAAGVVGLVAVSGAAGFAIGHESEGRDSSEQFTAQRGPDGDGQSDRGSDQNGDSAQEGNGMPGRGYTDRDGDGDGFGHHDDMNGYGSEGGGQGTQQMPGHGRGFGENQAPGMTELPTPQDMLQWLEDQGVDMQQFMDEFDMGGQGQGQGMRQSS